ncbi:putative 2,4-dienoyl-CoA reductase [compost metagenome]
MMQTHPWSSFANAHVFVAGGTSGINLGIARAFARCGAKVAVLGRNAEKAANAAAELGPQALGLAADVRDPQALGAALEKAVEAFGPIDVLISGAAGNFLAAATDMSCNAFKTVVDIDLLGTFNVVRLGHQHLRGAGSSVLTISAPQASIPTPLQSHACAAKAGMEMLTRTLAVEWGRQGIRVNALVPGPIGDTEGMRRLAPDAESTKRTASLVPLGRYGTLEEVANAALFLSSTLASYISGTVLNVDGGYSQGGAMFRMGA